MAFDVSTADIESRWRGLSAAESDIAFKRLQDADRKLRFLRPGLLAFYNGLIADVPPITKKTDLLEAIRTACAEAVIRFLRNPDMTNRQDIGSEGSIGIGYDTAAEGGVFISRGDLTDIDAAVSAAAGTVPAKVASRQLVSTFPWRTTDVTILPTP